MDSHELDGDTSFLANLTNGNCNDSPHSVDIHREGQVYLSSSPAEQLLIINRNLQAAAITEERILRLATRYILDIIGIIDKLYDKRADTERLFLFEEQDWLVEDRGNTVQVQIVLDFVNDALMGINVLIGNPERQLGRVEQRLFTRQAEGMPTTSPCDPSNELVEVQNKLQAQVEELELLKKTLVNLAIAKRPEESQPYIDKYSATVQMCTDQKTAQAFVQEVQEQEPQVDDSEYCEVKDEGRRGKERRGRLRCRCGLRCQSQVPSPPTPHPRPTMMTKAQVQSVFQGHGIMEEQALS
ncbi:hypothetical protein Aduo_004993 [Ancylostoma duodenale]